jgi:hypothetical protein
VNLGDMPEGFRGRIEDLVGTFGDHEEGDGSDGDGSRPSTAYDRKEISALIAYSKVNNGLWSEIERKLEKWDTRLNVIFTS